MDNIISNNAGESYISSFNSTGLIYAKDAVVNPPAIAIRDNDGTEVFRFTNDGRAFLKGVEVIGDVAFTNSIKSLIQLIVPIMPDTTPFQYRVLPWMLSCFGTEISNDKVERNHRFLEEALELVQATGMTSSEAHQLVEYVFNRPVGEARQEVGGVMVTLAALCLAQGLDMHNCGDAELERVWTKIEKIRQKQAAKPKYSPLPEPFLDQAKVKSWTECRDMFCTGSISWTLLDDKINSYLEEHTCHINEFSSACCNQGTKSCTVTHSVASVLNA